MAKTKPNDLEPFRRWLLAGGAAESTVRIYCLNVSSCLRDDRGVTARLVDRALAPKTRHGNMAALTSWATFQEDGDLLKELRRISLPPALRVTAKIQLEIEEWQRVIRAARDLTGVSEPMRAALLIICIRGLRCHDTLMLTPRDVREALRSGKLIGEAKGGKRIEYAAKPMREALEILAAEKGAWGTVMDLIVPRSRLHGYERERVAVRKLERAIKRVAKRAGVLHVHPHRMRRTYATHFLMRLQNDPRALLKLQEHMGWSQMATAAQYVDAIRREELDKLGETMTDEVAGPPSAPDPAPKRPRKR